MGDKNIMTYIFLCLYITHEIIYRTIFCFYNIHNTRYIGHYSVIVHKHDALLQIAFLDGWGFWGFFYTVETFKNLYFPRKYDIQTDRLRA